MADYIDPYMPKTLQDLIQRRTPYNLQAAIPSLSMLYAGHSDMDSHTVAGVDRAMPSTIIFNKNATPGLHDKYKQMVPHEYEHVLQNNVDKRYKENRNNYDGEIIDQYMKLTKTGRGEAKHRIIQRLINANNKELYDYLHKKGYTPSPYLGDAPKDWYSIKEQFADLSGIESTNKIDLTQDPVIRKLFFNDDQAFIDVYKGTTGLRTNRLDSKDLPPMTAYPKSQKVSSSGLLQQIFNK